MKIKPGIISESVSYCIGIIKSISIILLLSAFPGKQEIIAAVYGGYFKDIASDTVSGETDSHSFASMKKELPVISEYNFANRADTQQLFNGVSLEGWEAVDFTGSGQVSVSDGCIIIGKGLGISGIKWTREVPVKNYEVSLEAKRVEGEDFFCGLTFPVLNSYCTFVVGGWGGCIVGLSSIDDEDAANNITYDYIKFETNRWYKIRVRVTDEKIETWIDQKKIVDFTIDGHRISLRWEAECSRPMGVVTWQTKAAVRNIRLY
jgi:hypothetical protein